MPDHSDKPGLDQLRADLGTPQARIEDALTKVGAEHSPPTGWEDRVVAATMSLDYRTRVRALIESRLNRLFRLLALEAPDCIVATELELIGGVAVMLDPHGMARRAGERNERTARERIGLCAHLGCASEPADDGQEFGDKHCDAHAERLRIDTAYNEQLDADIEQVPS